MKRIIVPTDFSEISEYGLQMALALANAYEDAEIYLMNIVAPPEAGGLSSTGENNLDFEEGLLYVSALRRANERKLKKIVAQYENSGITIIPTLLVDHFQDGINSFIEKHNIDLVIMGTSRESTFEEFFIGNHTEQVMRKAKCPVIAVKSPVTFFSVNHILLTIDVKDPSEINIRHIKNFASYFDACIHLLYVSSDKSKVEEKGYALESLALENQLTNYTINVISDSNKEATIIRFAREYKMDMIASLTHGRSGLAHLIMGSIAEDLVKDTDIPVMTINLRAA